MADGGKSTGSTKASNGVMLLDIGDVVFLLLSVNGWIHDNQNL